MRREILLVIAMMIVAMATAQNSNTISFQGSLTTPGTNNPIADGPYDMVFTLYDSTNTSIWTEAQSAVQVTNGFVSVQLGSVTPLDITKFYRPLELEITIGGETLAPRIEFSTVPFSQTAKALVSGDSIVFRLANQKAGILDQTNTAIGYFSFTQEQGSGFFNQAFGNSALQSNNGGSQNVGVGSFALASNTTGNINIGIGYEALNANTISSGNVGVGFRSLYSNTDGYENVALGNYTLNNNTIGFYNTAIGSNALEANENGERNVAVGYNVLFNNTGGHQNTGIGDGAMALNTIGVQNAAVGAAALLNNTEGSRNTALGHGAVAANITASENTGIGAYALEASQGIGNTAVGSNSLRAHTTGDYNVSVGFNAGNGAVGVAQVNGTNNTLIGTDANIGVDGLTNATAIGFASVVSQDNSLVLGNNSVNVGIGTSTPAEKLSVNGNIASSGTVTADSYQLSNNDMRWYSMLPQSFSVSSNNSNVTHIEANNQIYRAITGGTGSTARLIGQINLPQGATIIGFTANVFDGDATNDITLALIRKSVSTVGTPIVVTSVSTTGTPSSTPLLSPIISEEVNNELFAYGIRYETIDNNPSFLVLYNVRVTYTVSSLD